MNKLRELDAEILNKIGQDAPDMFLEREFAAQQKTLEEIKFKK